MEISKKVQGLIFRCFECGERLAIEYGDSDPNVSIKYHACKYRTEKPDAYLAQDLENRFSSIYFIKGKYHNAAIMISSIIFLSAVDRIDKKKPENGYQFLVYSADNVWGVRYEDKVECRREREKLLIQIEAYWSQEK